MTAHLHLASFLLGWAAAWITSTLLLLALAAWLRRVKQNDPD